MRDEAREAFLDPARFVRVYLGHDPWPTAERILRALAVPRARVAVKACHASGKTFTAAEAVLWWLATDPAHIAITTAPTWTQVQRQLWPEVHKALDGSRLNLGGVVNQTEIRLGPENYAIGLSTNQGVRFQGFHGSILLVMDEAVGVLGDIWEAIEGIRAGGDVRVLALGNPTIPNGPFYDAFAGVGWTTFTINAFDTPNLEGVDLAQLLVLPDDALDVAPRPYLVTRRWVREKYLEVGERSPVWQARVLGQFPDQSEDALLSLAWLEAARDRDGGDAGDWEAGIDVAGPGEDETVLCIRQGVTIRKLQAWADPDPRGPVLATLAPYKDRLKGVRVDSVGQGYYFARHLSDHGYRVQDVNVGEASSKREKYANLKAELYWALRERAQQGDMAGLTDDLARSQLAGIRYAHTARGQIEIERKDDIRKRGGKSPDRAEAVMLAFAPPVGAGVAVLEYYRQKMAQAAR